MVGVMKTQEGEVDHPMAVGVDDAGDGGVVGGWGEGVAAVAVDCLVVVQVDVGVLVDEGLVVVDQGVDHHHVGGVVGVEGVWARGQQQEVHQHPAIVSPVHPVLWGVWMQWWWWWCVWWWWWWCFDCLWEPQWWEQ